MQLLITQLLAIDLLIMPDHPEELHRVRLLNLLHSVFTLVASDNEHLVVGGDRGMSPPFLWLSHDWLCGLHLLLWAEWMLTTTS